MWLARSRWPRSAEKLVGRKAVAAGAAAMIIVAVVLSIVWLRSTAIVADGEVTIAVHGRVVDAANRPVADALVYFAEFDRDRARAAVLVGRTSASGVIVSEFTYRYSRKYANRYHMYFAARFYRIQPTVFVAHDEVTTGWIRTFSPIVPGPGPVSIRFEAFVGT